MRSSCKMVGVLIWIIVLLQVESKRLNKSYKKDSRTPRIFWGFVEDAIEDSGYFPIVINVPELVGSMFGAVGNLFGAASSAVTSQQPTKSLAEFAEILREIIHDINE